MAQVKCLLSGNCYVEFSETETPLARGLGLVLNDPDESFGPVNRCRALDVKQLVRGWAEKIEWYIRSGISIPPPEAEKLIANQANEFRERTVTGDYSPSPLWPDYMDPTAYRAEAQPIQQPTGIHEVYLGEVY